ncbi:hypothetical protein [Streptomyces sp. NPDC088915]|uniref:hypothetical protein n=1 Tax=Streptomyces sp. NPDC088915 TaxID=3365912 RepID=UPI0038121F3A
MRKALRKAFAADRGETAVRASRDGGTVDGTGPSAPAGAAIRDVEGRGAWSAGR